MVPVDRGGGATDIGKTSRSSVEKRPVEKSALADESAPSYESSRTNRSGFQKVIGVRSVKDTSGVSRVTPTPTDRFSDEVGL